MLCVILVAHALVLDPDSAVLQWLLLAVRRMLVTQCLEVHRGSVS